MPVIFLFIKPSKIYAKILLIIKRIYILILIIFTQNIPITIILG